MQPATYIYPSSVTLRGGNLQKPYQSINTSYPIRKTWLLYLLLEKKLAIASYTKALFVQKWQMFSESDRRGIYIRDPSQKRPAANDNVQNHTQVIEVYVQTSLLHHL
jgi:hypothetical protein